MPRKPLNAHSYQKRRPPLESETLEPRRLLNGSFSHQDRQFSYTTPSGGHALIQTIGRGSLAGTSVNHDGALNLVYGGTNAFSKIVSQVHGGDGSATLESIENSQLIAAGAQNSVSGVGGNVLQAVLLGRFDLVPGGSINLTSGVNTLILDSIGANTQVHLRSLPPPPTPSSSSFTSSAPVSIITTRGTIGAVISGVTTTPASTEGTLEAGQSTTVTLNGVTATYVSNGVKAQTLGGISGNFSAGTNLVEPLATGQPPSIPPAPPGIILKVNSIQGSTSQPIDLLTDPVIFGYDAMTKQLVRFQLDLTTNTGKKDPNFTPINVPGGLPVAGVGLAANGSQLDVLVSSGTTVYAYNASTGAPVGSFTTSVPIGSIASADNVTVLGSYQPNQLQMINLAASLQTGQAQMLGNAQPFTPRAGFTLLGGLASVPGSNDVYADVAATFNSFQPTLTQLGIQQVSTAEVLTLPGHGTVLSNQFNAGASTALTQKGTFTNITPGPTQTGPAMGSVDQSLALVASTTNGTNVVKLFAPGSSSSSGTLTIDYADPLEALSGTFRTGLTSSALVDIQGNVQSIRGGDATGMVLNDSGNLNLVKLGSVTDSTIVGQPVSHVQIAHRSNVTILTPSRTVGSRNDVKVDHSLNPIGPLSLTGESP
jgi:hypothetical protein